MQHEKTAAPDDGNCPACEMSGVTADQARVQAPAYMAALDKLDSAEAASPESAPRIPSEPTAWCWDCRELLASGVDPHALVFGEPYPYAIDDVAQGELGRILANLGLGAYSDRRAVEVSS